MEMIMMYIANHMMLMVIAKNVMRTILKDLCMLSTKENVLNLGVTQLPQQLLRI
jgi:hypothetical protein